MAGQSDGRSLALLASGPQPPNPSELLESGRMREVLSELHETFDVVVLDSPALGAVSDALALVPIVSDIIIVGSPGKTTRDAASDLRQQFNLLAEEPAGIVVDFAEAERARYSHYYRSEPADSPNPVR